MKLSKSIQEFTPQNVWQQTLEITVDYNPATGTVDDIISVIARDSRSHVGFDMTKLFTNQLPGVLDDLVSATDWQEIYSEHKRMWKQSKLPSYANL